MKKDFLTPLLLFFAATLSAQNDRLNDFNNINWLQTINTIGINKKWSVHAEYQWRRENGLKLGQQSLLRTGINYKWNDNITTQLGYAWIETYPYGDFPIAAAGTFPEHRLYEQISFRHPFKRWVLTHRFRTEQRWLGRVKPGTGNGREIDSWAFLHRFRYQFRAQYSLWSRKEQQLYSAAADELLIGAGKDLGVNIFDQNRIFLVLGYRINKHFTLEGGYLNQTLQQGRRVGNNTIMQRNNGVVLTSLLNL